MANAKVLEFGFGLDFGPKSFSDLAKHLEEYLERAKNLPDLERLIKALNPALKDSRYSEDERHELKKLRQRAYDRRRHSKLQNLDSFQIIAPDPDSKSGLGLEADPSHNETPSEVKLAPTAPLMPAALHMGSPALQVVPPSEESTVSKTAHHVTPQSHPSGLSFWRGVKRAFTSIDGEKAVRRLPAMLLLLSSTLLVSWFLWLQSVDLYAAVGFSSPQLTAAGSLLLVVGFAAFHSFTGSKLALLLCIYAGAYEGYFMVSGTLQDENARRLAAVDADSELRFLKEKLERTRSLYTTANARYLEQGSDVFMNSWFKKKYLDPAWSDLEAAQGAVSARLDDLTIGNSTIDITVLKVLYRLGIVVLSMILVHCLCRARHAHCSSSANNPKGPENLV